METIKSGQFVQVHYKGSLDNGEVFDSSQGRDPLEVQLGTGQLIKGFENELLGMGLTEKKTFTLSPEEAYGHRDESLQHSFDRKELPAEAQPKVDDTVGLQSKSGQQVPARVLLVDEEKVVVDLNHVLAGKSLTFDIEVVGVSDTATQAGSACGCCSEAAGSCGSQGSCCS